MSALPTVLPITIATKRLSGSISPSATSFSISDILGWDGTDLVAGDFGQVAYGAFRDAQGTVLELFSFDPTTIASGSITFVHRGLSFSGDRITEIAANKLEWVKGTTLVELGSDFPQLYQYFKEYIDNIAISGAPVATTSTLGLSKASIAPVSPSAPIFVGDNDPRVPQNAYGVDAGSNDTYVITLTTPPAAYAAGQMYEFKANTVNTGTATLNVNSLGAKNILKGTLGLSDGDIRAGQIVQVIYDGTNFQLIGVASIKFGGDGADGVLTVTSGNTNIDCAGAQFLVKNYSSISITGTGSVTFINPHANGTTIILKSQGDVTLTSSAAPMLNASGMGAAGGAAVSVSGTSASTTNGNIGTVGKSFAPFVSNAGLGGTTSAGTDAAVTTALSFASFIFTSAITAYKYGMSFWLGAGGGSGSAYNNTGGTLALTSGVGGIGGGCLIIECGGAWNFTTTGGISVAGQVGGAATGSGTTNGIAGGGGGGASGFLFALYNILTANSGTVTVTGGAVGANTLGTGNAARGGGGANPINPGATGVGAAGFSFIAKNSAFA